MADKFIWEAGIDLMTQGPTMKMNESRKFVTLARTPGPLKGLLLLLLVAACGTSEPQIDPTTRISSDPILASVVTTFRTACVENAPGFPEARMKAAFSANQPTLAPGMMFIASGKPGRSCRVTVRGYGPDRPKPTVGDVNSLGQTLLARVGGTFKPKRPDASAGGAQVRVNGRTYNVFAYVSPKGDLSFSVFQ